MLGVADRRSSLRLIGAVVNDIRTQEIESQSADEDQYDVGIGVHYPDEILKIGEQYGES